MAGHRYSDGRWVTVDSHGSDGFQPDGTVDPQLEDGEPRVGGVPDGTVAEVVDWVCDDPHRARQARDAELGRARPRSGVLDVADRLLADA